jgi:hypothetical protein
VSEDSSLRLCPSDNAVEKIMVSVLLEHGTPSVSVEIEGRPKRLILDTGSNVSILQPGMSRREVWDTRMKPYGVTGEVLDIKGRQTVLFTLNGHEFEH